MTIVMGADQHRAQTTTEWLDTETGEISRARVAPADRARVRRFLERFVDEELEVALEATPGWRFVAKSSSGSAPRCISPNRRTPRRCAAARTAPRTTGRMPAMCGS